MSHPLPRRQQNMVSPMSRTLRSVQLLPQGEALAMRQLRHQTKNALQRIIAQVAACDLRATVAGGLLADQVERRIMLSARVSDALFGLTEQPGPLHQRLQSLCESTVALLGDIEQTLHVEVAVAGQCSASVEATVLQVAHEMVGNAVKHGMHMRLTGRVVVTVQAQRPAISGVLLTVSDDGWGADAFGDAPPKPGYEQAGLSIMQALADQHDGTVELSRENGWTVARLHLPGPL